jgi:hypothetical protein
MYHYPNQKHNLPNNIHKFSKKTKRLTKEIGKAKVQPIIRRRCFFFFVGLTVLDLKVSKKYFARVVVFTLDLEIIV